MLVMGDSAEGADVDEARAAMVQSAQLFIKLLDAAILLGKHTVSLQSAGWHGMSLCCFIVASAFPCLFEIASHCVCARYLLGV